MLSLFRALNFTGLIANKLLPILEIARRYTNQNRMAC